MLLTGTAYAEVQRSPLGDVLGLWPLNPRLTQPQRLENGTLVFRTNDGESGGQYREIDAENVLHLPMFATADGLVGHGTVTGGNVQLWAGHSV